MTDDAGRARRVLVASHAILALGCFAAASLVIARTEQRAKEIFESLDLVPFSTAASLAYGWGSEADASATLRELLRLAEQPVSGKYAELRRMDADMAKFRLALIEHKPESELAAICARATVRCGPQSLERMIRILARQRHVADRR